MGGAAVTARAAVAAAAAASAVDSVRLGTGDPVRMAASSGAQPTVMLELPLLW